MFVLSKDLAVTTLLSTSSFRLVFWTELLSRSLASSPSTYTYFWFFFVYILLQIFSRGGSIIWHIKVLNFNDFNLFSSHRDSLREMTVQPSRSQTALVWDLVRIRSCEPMSKATITLSWFHILIASSHCAAWQFLKPQIFLVADCEFKVMTYLWVDFNWLKIVLNFIGKAEISLPFFLLALFFMVSLCFFFLFYLLNCNMQGK